LTENVFKDITFEAIEIREAYNLLHIHKNAFNDMINEIESLAVVSTPLKNSLAFYDIFTAISLTKILKTLKIFNTSITEIPDIAFQPGFTKAPLENFFGKNPKGKFTPPPPRIFKIFRVSFPSISFT
jgi:hypothetical protein